MADRQHRAQHLHGLRIDAQAGTDYNGRRLFDHTGNDSVIVPGGNHRFRRSLRRDNRTRVRSRDDGEQSDAHPQGGVGAKGRARR